MSQTDGNSLVAALRTFGGGILMGACDIVPGVSGGTVALILGIYERLLTAISGIGPRFLSLLGKGQFRQAAKQIDFGFLLALAAGIATGIIALAWLIHHLLDNHQQLTLAVFFGLVAASGLLVARLVRPSGSYQKIMCTALGLASGVVAAWVVTTSAVAPQPGYVYLFGCGAIAICAMILPGISGAYILLLLGMYEHVTGTLKTFLKQAVHGSIDWSQAATIAVFCAGCLTGLLLFSRFLKWLLKAAHSETMAVLAGLMIGSLVRIWPFSNSGLKEPADPYLPSLSDPVTWTCAGLMTAGFVAVLALDRFARRQ